MRGSLEQQQFPQSRVGHVFAAFSKLVLRRRAGVGGDQSNEPVVVMKLGAGRCIAHVNAQLNWPIGYRVFKRLHESGYVHC